MLSGKIVVIAVVALVIGFGAGFALRPVLSPVGQTVVAAGPLIAASPTAARGTQYFEAHVDQAQKVVAECRNGTVRGDECANAERAIVVVQARENRQRFLGH